MELLSREKFINFVNEQHEDETPDEIKLTDGRYLYFWEEPFGDMAGENNYFIKYAVSPDNDFKNSKVITYKEIESLLSPTDKKELEEYQKELGDSNAANSIEHVK